ncbi:MAG TPA: polymer-forming cytoskeletal protein [Acidobacteriota bacterium]|jgi:cytoskeletal protein CcmA (bactofilin family)|nr:polymer-forming cytoskeletal protein [Acidobacteriota bacterium]
MKDKKHNLDETKITGFFDKNTKFKGDLEFKGSFRLDGRFKGNINSESTLIVGDNGKVEADIKIGSVSISGEVKGTIQAKEKVEVHSNGKIIGSIITPKLIVEEGAFLEANCQTTDKIPQSSPLTSKKEIEDTNKEKKEEPKT